MKIQVRSVNIKPSVRDQAVMDRAKRSAERAKKAENIKRKPINVEKRSFKLENVARMEGLETESSEKEISAAKEEPREQAKLRDHVKQEARGPVVKARVEPTDTKPHDVHEDQHTDQVRAEDPSRLELLQKSLLALHKAKRKEKADSLKLNEIDRRQGEPSAASAGQDAFFNPFGFDSSDNSFDLGTENASQVHPSAQASSDQTTDPEACQAGKASQGDFNAQIKQTTIKVLEDRSPGEKKAAQTGQKGSTVAGPGRTSSERYQDEEQVS